MARQRRRGDAAIILAAIFSVALLSLGIILALASLATDSGWPIWPAWVAGGVGAFAIHFTADYLRKP